MCKKTSNTIFYYLAITLQVQSENADVSADTTLLPCKITRHCKRYADQASIAALAVVTRLRIAQCNTVLHTFALLSYATLPRPMCG